LNRGVRLRSNAVSTLPFAILRGETEVDTSDEYENKTGLLPDPESLFYLIEAALTILGKCYLFREKQAEQPEFLRYLLPTSIEPILDSRLGLTGFKRQLDHGSKVLSLEEVVWFWSLDPFVEIGPGNDAPVNAALAAAGVLYNVDQFAAQFFKRGAIKSKLLAVKGTPSTDERQKLKSWWKRLLSGVENAWSAEVVSAEGLEVIEIGEGIQELADTALNQQNREDISTALGIPQTMLWSNAANYATAQEDRLSFYKETILPEALFIQRTLNRHVFEALGLRFAFLPETLDVFKTDENQASQSYLNYVNAGMPPSVAAQILGIELPPGVTPESLDEAAEPEPMPPALAQAQAEQGLPLGQSPGQIERQQEQRALQFAILGDLEKWARKAALKGIDVAFASEFIPADLAGRVRAALAGTNGAGIEAVFAGAIEEVKAASAAPFCEASQSGGWHGYP